MFVIPLLIKLSLPLFLFFLFNYAVVKPFCCRLILLDLHYALFDRCFFRFHDPYRMAHTKYSEFYLLLHLLLLKVRSIKVEPEMDVDNRVVTS